MPASSDNPPGTARRSPHTGAVAVRMARGAGLGEWLIAEPGRGVYYTNDRNGSVAEWPELR